MMQGFTNGSFFGMGFGMLAVVAAIFVGGIAIGYLIGRAS